jgi:hypothetical protein
VGNSVHDVFNVLLRTGQPVLWKWAWSELPHQHPVTGDTIFHILCRSHALGKDQKMEVLADLKMHRRNPLTPNYRNKLCVDMTSDPELKKALEAYMCWQPDKRVMKWFGPLFQRRARALLLVCQRLKRDHRKRLAPLNRDVRHLLVKYVSRVEYLYVPNKI